MSVDTATPRGSGRLSDTIREAASKYGLIAVAARAAGLSTRIKDLASDGNLDRPRQQPRPGLSNGAIFALIALGYTLVYGIIELINFAHGEVFMIGSFIAVRPVRQLRPQRGHGHRSASSSACS